MNGAAKYNEVLAENVELKRQLLLALERIAELERQLKLSSSLSSKPPSSDFPKPPRYPSPERKLDKASGGQRGRQGKTLKMVEHPDEVIVHPLLGQCPCGASWDSIEASASVGRQVFDLPEVKLFVTEHQVEVKCCPECGRREQAAFPAATPSRVQYGPHVLTLALYLHQTQYLSLARTCEAMHELFGVELCEATVLSASERAYQQLNDFEQHAQQALQRSGVLHADETSYRQDGQNAWLHVVSNARWTLLSAHASRGKAALVQTGVLNDFQGTVLHDAYGMYFSLDIKHALCAAHLLRELRALVEFEHEDWAAEMQTVLHRARQHVEDAKVQGNDQLSPAQRHEVQQRYQSALAAGFKHHATLPKRQRGKQRQRRGKNLLDRLHKHQDAVLRFTHDFRVPFTNNLAERDLRMVKLRQKVSGSFRGKGASHFARIRSFVSTLRKQGHAVFLSLLALFLPALQPLLLSG